MRSQETLALFFSLRFLPSSEKYCLWTYMPAGLADSADGETACSRSGAWPAAWLHVSAGPSRPSARGSRGAGKSPVGDSQDKSPLLAYSSSIWVVVRRRAWGDRMGWSINNPIHQELLANGFKHVHGRLPCFSALTRHIASLNLTTACWNARRGVS